MLRLSNSQKNKIIALSNRGASLNQIEKLMDISKTTIYYHVRKKFGKKIKEVTIDNSNERKIGEFVGLFAGDGSYFFDKEKYLYRVRIYLNKNERNVLQYYTKLLEKLFGKPPNVFYYKSIAILDFRSKVIVNLLKSYLKWRRNKTYTIGLKDYNKLSIQFLKGFAKGLIDSDGYVRCGQKEIYFGSTSPALNKNFVDTLKLLDIKYKCYVQKRTNRHVFYKTRIPSDEVTKFIRIINPIKASGLAGIRTQVRSFSPSDRKLLSYPS